MSLIRKHVAVLQAWACLALVKLLEQALLDSVHIKLERKNISSLVEQ